MHGDVGVTVGRWRVVSLFRSRARRREGRAVWCECNALQRIVRPLFVSAQRRPLPRALAASLFFQTGQSMAFRTKPWSAPNLSLCPLTPRSRV